MLLMVKKGIRLGMCHSIYQYAKANKKYMKDYDSNRESSYLQYQEENNLHGWAISQTLPAKKLNCVKDISKFDERFIKKL